MLKTNSLASMGINFKQSNQVQNVLPPAPHVTDIKSGFSFAISDVANFTLS